MLKNSWDSTFRYIVMVVSVITLIALLWYVRGLFQPLTTAALIAYLLSPLVNLLSRKTGLNRKKSATIVFFVVIFGLAASLVTIIPELLEEIKKLTTDLNVTLDNYQKILVNPVYVLGIPVFLEGFIPAIRSTLSGMMIPKVEQALQILQTTSRGFLWFLIVIVSTYHLMTEWDKLREWLIGLAPISDQDDIRRLYKAIKNIWLSYLGGQVRLMLILAVIYSLAWSLIGLRGAILIGILAGFFNLIPEVGPGITAVIAILFAWLEGSTFLPISNGWFAVLTGGIYLVLNNFKTIYLQPRILGKSVLLHEGIVFVAIVAAIMIQGVMGVLIVVPLLASVMIVGRYIHRKLLGVDPFNNSAETL